MSRTRPGSRAHRILQVARRLTGRLGRGALVAELRDEYERATGRPAPSSFTAEVSSLKRRGVLEVVGGRSGRSLYAPAGSEVDGGRPDDDATRVRTALRAAAGRVGRPVTTREVGRELERRGAELSSSDPNAVKKRLEMLARRTRRGPPGARPPRVIWASQRTETGRPYSLWLPVEEGPLPAFPRVPPTHSDAVRLAVRRAEEGLGRPVSRRELRGWLARAETPAALRDRLPAREVGTRLTDTGRHDHPRAHQPGRIRAVETPLTCHGGPPLRWSVRPPAPETAALCRMEDTLLVLRPARETRTLQALKARGRVVGEELLPEVAAVRRDLAVSSLREAAGEASAEGVLDRVDEVTGRLWDWYRAGRAELTRDQRQRRRSRLHGRELRAREARGLLRFSPDASDRGVLGAGQAAAVEIGALRPYADAAARALGLDDRKGARLFEGARRFPAPEPPGRERFGAAGELPLSRVDRPDALLLLFRALNVPRAAGLVGNAALLLGPSLRDAELLRARLAELPPGRTFARHCLLVALGLLGEPVGFEAAVCDPSRPEEVAAWAVAAVAADLEGAAGRIEEADRRARGQARRITDTALRRLEGGYPLSIVE